MSSWNLSPALFSASSSPSFQFLGIGNGFIGWRYTKDRTVQLGLAVRPLRSSAGMGRGETLAPYVWATFHPTSILTQHRPYWALLFISVHWAREHWLHWCTVHRSSLGLVQCSGLLLHPFGPEVSWSSFRCCNMQMTQHFVPSLFVHQVFAMFAQMFAHMFAHGQLISLALSFEGYSDVAMEDDKTRQFK